MILETADLRRVLKITNVVKSEFVIYSASGGYLTASDGFVSVKVEDESLRKPDGLYIFPAQKFSSFVNKAGKLITLTSVDNVYQLVSGRFSVKFPAPDVAEKPQTIFEYTLEMPCESLKTLVTYGSTITSAKEIKTITSVLEIKADEDLFSEPLSASYCGILSTDGHRASSLSVPCVSAPFRLLLPVSAVPCILGFTEDKVQIHDGANILALKCGGVEVAARKFSVEFPNVASVFQTEIGYKATVDGDDLLQALSNIHGFLDSQSPDVIVSFGQTLTVDTGTAKDEIDYADGDPSSMGLSFKTPHKYIVDFLHKKQGPVRIGTSKDKARVLMQSGDKKYLFVTKK